MFENEQSIDKQSDGRCIIANLSGYENVLEERPKYTILETMMVLTLKLDV